MAGEHYKEFIDKSYIGPIRSVLIVDDDYPTVEEILGSQHRSLDAGNDQGEKLWRKRPDRVARMIQAFRQRSTPLLVDIHDGTDISNDTKMATHLHQCDLLVLDYQLERAKPRDGTRAIAVLRGVMANNHFNLVVIYTNEDLDFVFDAVRWGLVAPSFDSLSATESEDAQSLIDAGEDDIEGFERLLSESIDAEQYFHSHLNPSKYLQMMMDGEEPYAMFVEQAKRVDWTLDEKRVVLRYLLRRVERTSRVDADANIRLRDMRCSPSGPTWVATDTGFVAFAKKNDDDDLLSDLSDALLDWNPPPSHLVLAKIRAAIDEYGMLAQGLALRNRHALAYWYHRLLTSDSDEDRSWRIAESVSRHAGKLVKEILPNVEAFVFDLIRAERGVEDPTTICKDHFGVNLNDDGDKRRAALEHNAFVCSMEPTGWHLTTGHVFFMEGDHWLCVSPSCDMVPSQIPSWRKQTHGERLPFIGVRLHKVAVSKMPKGIYSNRFLFLQTDGDIKGYCFNGPKEDSMPHWFMLYAENGGHFSDQDFEFTVSFIGEEDSKLVARSHKANVVGQLRYEYALNLIQKLGISLTRIGLDFTDGTGS